MFPSRLDNNNKTPLFIEHNVKHQTTELCVFLLLLYLIFSAVTVQFGLNVTNTTLSLFGLFLLMNFNESSKTGPGAL